MCIRDRLTDPQVVAKRYDLSAALPFEPHLRIDTTDMSPAEAAAQIAAHYSLPLLPAHER